MALVANARMYGVNPEARAAWADLFAWLSRRSGVSLSIIAHAYPAPLRDLWTRADLACAFMCGFPFARAHHRPIPVAAPVPTAGPAPGEPRYATRFVVASHSAFHTLEDTFGGRLGYTVEDSHSGFNAMRHHLLAYRTPERPALYGASIGPLVTPRRVIEALLSGTIDVGPLDSYAFDLTLRHEPELARLLRVVASTQPAPIPFLVASPTTPPAVIAALRASLLAFGEAPDCVDLRDRLCLLGFAPVDASAYDMLSHWDNEACAAGYSAPG